MISKKLKELRKEYKYSQEGLANKLGVSRQAITKWETGMGLPDIDNLIAIAKLFNITIDDLINHQENIEVNKMFIYESVVEYDIDGFKDFDITFMGANTFNISSYEGEKLLISLASNIIENIQKSYKVKIDDLKKKIDIDIKRFSDLSETDVKKDVYIDIKIPKAYIGKIEIEGNTDKLMLNNIINDNIEYIGKAKIIDVKNIISHVELNTNEDCEIFIDKVEGNIDLNQVSATSKLSISSTDEFAYIAKGFITKIICNNPILSVKAIEDKPKLIIELNGMKTELTILPLE